MLQLFGHPFSSYAWKALIPLHAHAVAFEFRVIDPEYPDNQAVVQQHTPAGKFPLLLDGDPAVFEATAIIEYLAANWPECRDLIPADFLAAARTRMLDRVLDNYVMANMIRVVQAHLVALAAPDQVEIQSARDALARAYRWLDAWLEAEGEPLAVTLVTCASMPIGYSRSPTRAAGDLPLGERRCSRCLRSCAVSTKPAPTGTSFHRARRNRIATETFHQRRTNAPVDDHPQSRLRPWPGSRPSRAASSAICGYAGHWKKSGFPTGFD